MNVLNLFTINRARLTAGFAVFLRVVVVASIALAAPGGTITSPEVAFNFGFELESPPGSLKEVPIWNEFEQMLDNPYAVALAPGIEGELVNGFPSYVTTINRRRSFLPAGCDYNASTAPPACNDALLEQFLIHPLNYNYMTGEEMRLVNPNYPGGEFDVPHELVNCAEPGAPDLCAETVTANSINGPVESGPFDPNRWVWAFETEEISAGAERVEETVLDFNSPFFEQDMTCIVGTEATPAEGSIICGYDPGEPGYAGFSVFNRFGYSTPAIRNVASPSTPISNLGNNGHRLFDPNGCAERNAVAPGSCSGAGFINRLLKPTLRPTPNGQPDYLQNSAAILDADPSALVVSNENDYIRGNNPAQKLAARDAAIVLGKALFWDMQVGSDGVQSCGTCHFSGGADDRTKNQVNPNTLGGDTTFQVADPNEELVATDFPFSNGGDTANHNDVASSMGVHFGLFRDIPTIGTFVTNLSVPANQRVPVLPMDLRSTTAADNIDPILGFAGPTNTNEIRRVEPRNTPTLFGSDFNFDNFWDGRARHDFNGGSVFGASDPQSHIFVCGNLNANEDNCPPAQTFSATRQLIRFSSLGSLATGPALSEFEMSFLGRNWQKIGKKLLQGNVSTNGGGITRVVGTVTPLANQLVDRTDSVLGLYSNQGGSGCAALPAYDRSPGWTAAGVANKPGLCISYPALIRKAFYPQLWATRNRHLDGCYTDGNAALHTPQCAPGVTDPFDGYVLSPSAGPASATDRNDFTQMEANFSLFFGLSVHLWGTILIPDDAPFDVFMEENPDAFKSLGEANEPGLVWDMPTCASPSSPQPCFTESGPFKRDPGVPLNLETGPGVTTGTRNPGDPDPLLGFDVFYGFNLSGKNPEFLAMRCGECHAGANTTDHTMVTSHQLSLGDFVSEFVTPGVEILIEPLGRDRTVSGFGLEAEINGNAQDAVERNIINQSVFDPEFGRTFPDGSAFFDNGVYNIGVTPINDDISRGGTDAFGWPLSLSRLMLKNLGGDEGDECTNAANCDTEPEEPLVTFDPEADPECAPNCITGGLFEETGQDQEINPGYEEEPANPLLPPYLAPFANNITVGDETEQDEAGGGGGGMVNTLTEAPLMEGYVDTLGPFNPAGIIGELLNNAPNVPMGTWPVVNRVGFMGSFKAPAIRNVELTGPYFHNGGKLTLAQVVDFYSRGGDFPNTNAHHRDFNIMDLTLDGQAQMTEEKAKALVDFLLTFTDDRVRNEQAPFDHPEIFVPLDGRAPENTFGRPGFMGLLGGNCLGIPGAGPCFLRVPAIGAGGVAPLGLPQVDGFLGVEVGDRNNPNCSVSAGPISQYCITISP